MVRGSIDADFQERSARSWVAPGRASWMMLALALLLPVGIQGATGAGPAVPRAERTVPDYSATYANYYVRLGGDVDVCISWGPDTGCLPVTFQIELVNQQVTEESLAFIVDTLTEQIAVLLPHLPPSLYPDFETLMAILYPPLIEELNMVIAALPPELAIRQGRNVPAITATMMLNERETSLPGAINVRTGEFQLIDDLAWGLLTLTAEPKGWGVLQIRLDVSTSAEMSDGQGGTTTVTLSLKGASRAGFQAIHP